MIDIDKEFAEWWADAWSGRNGADYRHWAKQGWLAAKRHAAQVADSDPIGELQREAREAKLVDFIGSMAAQVAETAPSGASNVQKVHASIKESDSGASVDGGELYQLREQNMALVALYDAAKRLIKAKGRFHTEKGYGALVAALDGVASGASVDSVARDAARYRWLKQNVSGGSMGLPDGWIDSCVEDWDAAIDAGMSPTKAGGEP